jgi:hypothetical protein
MSGLCDDEDDLRVAYLWGKAEANDKIKRLTLMVEARDLVIKTERAKNERLREALRIIGGLKVKDFKQSNYTHYDVCELHENAVHAAKVARAALGEDK